MRTRTSEANEISFYAYTAQFCTMRFLADGMRRAGFDCEKQRKRRMNIRDLRWWVKDAQFLRHAAVDSLQSIDEQEVKDL